MSSGRQAQTIVLQVLCGLLLAVGVAVIALLWLG